MSTSELPSYQQVLELPSVLEGAVAPDFIDANGHMNIRHYLDHGALGADALMRAVGVDDAYRSARRMGVFTAEHHLRYVAEMHEGTRFTVHPLFLDRSDNAGHLVALILDRTHGVLSCTVEILLVHVSMDSRRPTDFPADVASGIDAGIARARQISWRVPISGAMGIRRRPAGGDSPDQGL
jgi:acyl-CoA thioester hydrolase